MGTARTLEKSDGPKISFEIDGIGDPVVLLHGITEDRRSWRTVCELLTGDFQVVRVDLRGHGQSGRGPSYDLESLAEDIAWVLRDLEIDAPHLVGHSLGAATATLVAGRFGARSVTNVDQPMNFGALVPLLCPLEPDLRGPRFHETLQNLFGGLEGDRLDEGTRSELAAYHQRADQDVVLGCWDMIFHQTPEALDQMAGGMLRRINVPYLSMHGIDLGSEYELWLKERLPTASVEVWPGFGHWLHRAAPERFVERLRRFFNVVV